MAPTKPPTDDILSQPLPRQVQGLCPDDGIIGDFIRVASRKFPVTDPLVMLGCILPVVVYELARWGFFPAKDRAAFKMNQMVLRSVIVARSASGKSTGLQVARKFHRELMPELHFPREDGSPTPDPWISLTGTSTGLEDTLLEHYDPTTDKTLILAHAEEMTTMLPKPGSYKAGEEYYNFIFDGAPASERQENTRSTRDRRKEEGGKKAENPYVSGVFCTTSSMLKRTVTEQHREAGLLSRFSLWFNADGGDIPLAFAESASDMDEEIRQAELIQSAYMKVKLAWICSFGALGAAPSGDLGMHREVNFDYDARKTLNDFIRDTWKPAEDEIWAPQRRAVQTVIIVATCYAASRAHLTGDMGRAKITVRLSDAQQAVALVKKSLKTQQDVYNLTAQAAQAGTVSVPTVRFTDQVLELIKEAGPEGIAQDKLRQKVARWPGYNSMVLKNAMDSLCSEDYDYAVQRVPVKTNGRPKTRYLHKKWPVPSSVSN